MGKRSNLYEIYFGPADSKLGQGYGQIKNGPLGSQKSLGGNYGIYDEPDKYDVEDLDGEDIDITSKIDGEVPFIDPGTKANRQSSYTGAYTNLTEKSDHTTTMMQGISPNVSFRGSKGQKVTKTSMSSTTYPKIYNRPRVDMTATQYGTSRANLPKHFEQDDNIFSLDDLIDQHELSLNKHQNNINRIKKQINEIKVKFF